MNLSVLLRQCCLLFLLLSLVTGIIYPLAITGVAQLMWPARANGSLIRNGDRIVGSDLLGQEFTRDDYFWSRPSATSPSYNAGASSGSNLGPLNPTLKKNTDERLSALKRSGLAGPPPVDLVTSSASGLDPDISLDAAQYQAPRVAKLRGLTTEQVSGLITEATSGRQLGLLGEPRVNVLRLNLSLDKLTASRQPH